jgi:subtilisin family serine protease
VSGRGSPLLSSAAVKNRKYLAAAVAVMAFAMLVASAAVSAASSPSTKIDVRVQGQLDRNHATSFWVIMSTKANLTAAPKISNWTARGTYVMNALKNQANSSQRSLRSFLYHHGIKSHSYWIANAVLVYGADAAMVKTIAARPDVAKILPRWTGHIVDGKPGVVITSPTTIEWNINNIGAPKVWTKFSDRGEGIVVANIDTGTQYDHPALVNQYRGNNGDGTFDHNYNWFDPLHHCSGKPCDTFGHGTHTMGTMVGDDGGANQIGVAPAAKWIEAAALPDGNGTDQSLLDSGQWVIAPTNLKGKKPKPELRPDVVSNSWGIPGDDTDPWYQATVDAWIASGIFPAWAAGNEGPSCSSLREPGAYPESYTMGAYDINNNIAGFSSRGPSPFGGQSTTKPDIAAPGVNVRSSVPTNGYASESGTSMATPHVAAVVALIWSGAPSLRGGISATEKILSSTAHAVKNTSCGGNKKFNDVWGHGRVDAYAAVKKARAQFGP